MSPTSLNIVRHQILWLNFEWWLLVSPNFEQHQISSLNFEQWPLVLPTYVKSLIRWSNTTNNLTEKYLCNCVKVGLTWGRNNKTEYFWFTFVSHLKKWGSLPKWGKIVIFPKFSLRIPQKFLAFISWNINSKEHKNSIAIVKCLSFQLEKKITVVVLNFDILQFIGNTLTIFLNNPGTDEAGSPNCRAKLIWYCATYSSKTNLLSQIFQSCFFLFFPFFHSKGNLIRQ